MNRNSLLYKIVTNCATILAVILVAASIVLTFTFRYVFYGYKYNEINKQSKIIQGMIEQNGQVSNANLQMQDLVNDVEKVLDCKVVICDDIQLVYASSNGSESLISDSKIYIPKEYEKKLQQGKVIKNGSVGQGKNAEDAYLTPVFNRDTYWGTVVIAWSTEKINSYLFKIYRIIWTSTLVTLILCLFGINHFVKKQLINPLKEIYLVANKLARGEVDKRIQVKSNDEIGELAKSFNIMAESLESLDTNRRDFISNVSHELRSPITSMKGFIAGMLDGVIPKDKENYYLKLVYDEINRLSRLVNDLLDISSMEVGKFKLTIMEVDINALVKRCLLNIESKVRDKGIHVNATLENEHLYVYADSDRIMQVLTNLLDNAIKYGGDNGIISVSTRVKGPKVHVSVYNKGSMMTEEEMTHIWDRFYKSDKSRTNKESTGLGLPIVRLIMTQHKEDVWVRNEREGVVFTFTLAKV